MLGFGALGEFALGEGPKVPDQLAQSKGMVELNVVESYPPDKSLVVTEKSMMLMPVERSVALPGSKATFGIGVAHRVMPEGIMKLRPSR
jgi:hypothetical protein